MIEKPCICYGSCPYDQNVDTTQNKEKTRFCATYGYDCPVYDFAEKIHNSQINKNEKIVSEGDSHLLLADSGVDFLSNCEKAIKLYEKARRDELEPNTTSYGVALWKEGLTHLILANEGYESKRNYDRAIDLFKRARTEGLIKETVMFAESLISEGSAFNLLATLEDSKGNYMKSAELFRKARDEGFKKGTHSYASTFVLEGQALFNLARLGVEVRKNLDKMSDLFTKALYTGLNRKTSYNVILQNLEEATHDCILIQKTQNRVANISVGASTVRGQPKDTKKISINYLKNLDLTEFSNITEENYIKKLDEKTDELRKKLPESSDLSDHWGVTRKILNIFLIQAFHDKYLSKKYELEGIIHVMELPLDNNNGKILSKYAKAENIKWDKIKTLDKKTNLDFQKYALEMAKKKNCERYQLDFYLWRSDEDKEKD